MNGPFEIFELLTDGSARWLGSAETEQEAEQSVPEWADGAARHYVILGETGEEITVQTGGASSAAWQPPAWLDLYRETLKEEDRQKLVEKVAALETAIVERMRGLQGSREADEEKPALRRVLDGLLTVKHEKLNFPLWRPVSRAPEPGA